jgi:hypothetical protein
VELEQRVAIQSVVQTSFGQSQLGLAQGSALQVLMREYCLAIQLLFSLIVVLGRIEVWHVELLKFCLRLACSLVN